MLIKTPTIRWHAKLIFMLLLLNFYAYIYDKCPPVEWNYIKEKSTYMSLRHVLMDSNSRGSWRSNENTNGTLGLSNVSCRRGRLSAEVWVEGATEKGGEGVEDAEKE